ncbi:MAG TPA: nidogen-like domain-containing protein [Thermoleophilaceae bacterium]
MARYGAAKRLASLGALVVALVANGAGPAVAVGPNAIRQNLPAPGCQANTVVNERQAVPLSFTLEIGATAYSSLYVNASSGTVSFGRQFGKFRIVDPASAGDPVIAPLLANFDTRGAGSAQVTYGETVVNNRTAFCVNWVGVGYYSQHANLLNRVQLLLIKEPTSNDFDVEFNYDQIDWDHGDGPNGRGLNGPIAAMGYADGAGGYYVHPGSNVSGAFLDSSSSGLVHHSHGATTQDGRYIFEVRRPSPVLSGTILDGQGDPIGRAPVLICAQGGSPCFLRFASSSGRYTASGVAAGQTYELTAYPGVLPTGVGHATVTMPQSGDAVQDIALPGLAPVPAGTTVTTPLQSSSGIPVASWASPFTVSTSGCPGGSATYSLDVANAAPFTGTLTEGPAGTYTAVVPPQTPNHGLAMFNIAIACPSPGDDSTKQFNLYIDPSGFVRDSHGDGIPGATVTLYRSAAASGPFLPVEDGSTVMSPSNRTTPDLTDATGHFGWDVLAGFYRVRAEKTGCASNANRTRPYVWSRIMDIPPPVTDLDLRLYCARTTRIQAPTSLGTISVREPAAFALRGAIAECAPGSPRCTVTVTLTTRGRSPVRLGTARYRILGARLVPVEARLSPTGRTALAAAARLKVRAAIDIRKGGTSRSRTVRATLKRRF